MTFERRTALKFDFLATCPGLLQSRVTANGRVGATAAVYTAAILGGFVYWGECFACRCARVGVRVRVCVCVWVHVGVGARVCAHVCMRVGELVGG